MKWHIAVLGRSDQHNVFKILQPWNKELGKCLTQVAATYPLFAHVVQTSPEGADEEMEGPGVTA